MSFGHLTGRSSAIVRKYKPAGSSGALTQISFGAHLRMARGRQIGTNADQCRTARRLLSSDHKL